MAGRGKVIASPRLSWTTKFGVFKTDEPERPFIFQQRQGVESELEDTKKNKDILHMLDARYAMGYGLWQKAVQVELV
jgi:phage major head subunit gpT-like protein